MKFSTTELNVFQSPSGSSESIILYEFDSQKPGPEVYLQASVHGAEVQGNLVLFLLAQKLCEPEFQKTFKGKIRFVPLANPRATNQKIGTTTYGRFNPVTGHNWNRNYTDLAKLIDYQAFVSQHKTSDQTKIISSFKELLQKTIKGQQQKNQSYGPNDNKKLNLLLQSLAASADIVLDLHTGPIACRYLYAPEYLQQRSKDLLFPFTIVIPHEFAGAMDEACFVPWVELSRECEKQKIDFKNPFEAYTVELSSEESVCTEMAQEDLRRISHFLFKRLVFGADQAHQVAEPLMHANLSNYKTYYCPEAGLCEILVQPGQLVDKGEVLARLYQWHKVQTKNLDLPSFNEALQEIKALEAGVVINFTTSSIVNEGMELFQILESPER